ncbi:PP2C-like protein phosphatase [Cryptosporidium canis]|uniref:Protein phosphatase n=1 Tax=Cryptosporidium canis TaxID=195482 RepID=A0ABQ8P9B1_9CRYT|nr:PP2C-like protein phosphatase [Cryptosporidium canis]
MLKNEDGRKAFVESKECEVGIKLLKGLSSELEEKNEDNTREKRETILAILGILERSRQKLLRDSRSKLMNLKTRVIYPDEGGDLKELEKGDEKISRGLLRSDKEKLRICEKGSDSICVGIKNRENSLESFVIEIESGRREMGSWEDPIPSNGGVPYDYFERKIFDKFVDYWRNSKLAVPFSAWVNGERLERRKSSSIMSFELIEVNNSISCKSIQEAIYRIRKFEQDFQAIPEEIVFPIIEHGILINNSKNKLNSYLSGDWSRDNKGSSHLELNRAKIMDPSQVEQIRIDSSSFKVPQSLFFSMVLDEHENRSRDQSKRSPLAEEKLTSLVSNSSNCPMESNEICKKQCNCDFYKLRQRFAQEYNLFEHIGSNSNFEGLDKSMESNLRLWMGAYYLPRNDKRSKGGEDGWFLSENMQCMGVADGVGEWEDLCGKSARMFSNSLMRSSLEYIKSNRERVINKPSIMAKDSLKQSLNCCEKEGIHGASTALVACFDHYSGTIGFANMGDSGALVLRRLQFDTGKLEIVRRVKEMQHEFNCPYQFAALPPENEWPELLEKGYHNIVQLASIEKRSKEDPNHIDSESGMQLACDDPELSQLLEVPLKEGDMVILGTDGLFDNLFDFEIASISGLSFSPIESKLFYKCLDYTTTPMVIAKSIALSAYYKSLDPFAKTPFANQAKRFYSGEKNSLVSVPAFSGGKEDDISVLVAWVVHKDDFEILTKSSPHYCDISKRI